MHPPFGRISFLFPNALSPVGPVNGFRYPSPFGAIVDEKAI